MQSKARDFDFLVLTLGIENVILGSLVIFGLEEVDSRYKLGTQLRVAHEFWNDARTKQNFKVKQKPALKKTKVKLFRISALK